MFVMLFDVFLIVCLKTPFVPKYLPFLQAEEYYRTAATSPFHGVPNHVNADNGSDAIMQQHASQGT